MSETYTPIAPTPVFREPEEGPFVHQMEPSFGEFLWDQGANVIRDSATSSLFRSVELERAQRGPAPTKLGPYHPSNDPVMNPTGFPDKTMSAENLGAMAAEEGVSLPNLGTAKYTLDAATIMLDRARRKEVRESTIAAYDPGMGTALATSLLFSVADPLNVASAFIPFVGEARYGAWLAQASGLAGRTAVRLGAGAIEGFGGAAVLEPFTAEAAMQEGRDYQLADGMRNLLFGSVFGAGMHATFGAGLDVLFKRKFTVDPPGSMPELVDRLPVAVNEAAISAALSDLVHGKPVMSGEIIDAFIKADPDLAEAISYAATLRRDGPALDDVPGRIAYWEQQLEDLKTAPKKPVGFLTWLRSKGGIRDVDNDIKDSIGDTSHLGKAYISKTGAAKTSRGLTFDDLFEQAKAEGFVETRQQLRDAFAKDAGPVRKSEADLIQAHAEKLAHAERMIAESGVSAKTKNAIKARAIAGREQHIVTAERARLQTVTSKLEARRAEYKTIAEGGVPEVVRDFEPPKAKPAAKPDEISEGDTVDVVSEAGSYSMGMLGVKVTKLYDDPVYGKYAMVEGSQSAVPLSSLQLKGKAEVPQTPVQKMEAAVKGNETAETVGPREYSFHDVTKAIETAVKGNEGKRIKIKDLIASYFPGATRNQMQPILDRLIEERGLAIEKGEVYFRKLSPKEKTARTADLYNRKLDSMRRVLDAEAPGLGEKGIYYLSALFDRFVNQYELNPSSFAKHLTGLIKEGKLKARTEETGSVQVAPNGAEGAHLHPGEDLTTIPPDWLTPDKRGTLPDVLLTFSEKTPVAPERKPELTMRVEEPPTTRLQKIGEEEGTIEFHAMRGDAVTAKMKVFPNLETKTLVVENIVNAAGKNSIGPVAMREIVNALAEAFPDYTKVSGFRATGARAKAKEGGGSPNLEMALPLKKSGSTTGPKLGPLTPEELAAIPKGDEVRVETPPAPRDALTAAEIDKATSEYNALTETTLKRLEAMASQMDPKEAAALRQALDKLGSDTGEWEKVMNSAVSCLLNPR